LLWDSHGANSKDDDKEKPSIFKVAVECTYCYTKTTKLLENSAGFKSLYEKIVKSKVAVMKWLQ